MNRIMAFAFFMLFLAGMAFVMLKDMQSGVPPAAAPVRDITSGDWHVSDASKTDNAFVRFQADGQLNGFGGCNSFFGSFVATDQTLQVGPLGATRKACADAIMQSESQFLSFLTDSSAYRIVGQTLILIGPSGDELALVLNHSVQEKQEN